MEKPVLHAISTGTGSIDQFVSIAKNIHPYVQAIHIREHSKSAAGIYEMGYISIESGVPPEKLIINNRVDAAIALGAGGVHLGYHSLPIRAVKKYFPSLTIGKSVHSIQEAIQAEKDGADYIIYGHVFTTGSKEGLEPRGLKELKEVVRNVQIPVIAIGGIKPSNVNQVMDVQAAGIAVLSGIFKSKDPVKAVKAYRDILSNGDDVYEECL